MVKPISKACALLSLPIQNKNTTWLRNEASLDAGTPASLDIDWRRSNLQPHTQLVRARVAYVPTVSCMHRPEIVDKGPTCPLRAVPRAPLGSVRDPQCPSWQYVIWTTPWGRDQDQVRCSKRALFESVCYEAFRQVSYHALRLQKCSLRPCGAVSAQSGTSYPWAEHRASTLGQQTEAVRRRSYYWTSCIGDDYRTGRHI